MSASGMEELVERGRAYVAHHSMDRREYDMHAIAGYELGEPGNDGRRQPTITRLSQYDRPPASAEWLDVPLFQWNNSVEDPEFRATGNPLVNISECSPTALVSLGAGIVEGNVPSAGQLKDRMLDRVGATFFAGATPRALMEDVAQDVRFLCKDGESSNVHSVSAELFFGAIANRSLIAFDIHDIAHHAIQLQKWPSFYSRLGSVGVEGFGEETPSEEAALARHAAVLVSDATFEESLLSDDGTGQVYSFGCLNWLSPRDTPAAPFDITPQMPPDQQRLHRRWHALYALAHLYCTQQKASEELGAQLDWLERLGYGADPEFQQLSADPTALSRLDIRDADHINIVTPKNADELLTNAEALLKHLDLWR